jgi:oligogalacturonide lyase
MIYSAPDGIHILDMATRQTKLLVANPPQPKAAPGAAAPQQPVPGTVHILVAGHKTNSVFYTTTDANHVTAVYKADTNTGATRKLTVVPHLPNTSSWSVVSVNADETLIAGTYVEGDDTGRQYGSNLPAQPAGAAPGAAGNPDNRVGSAAQGPHYQPPNKSAMMVARLAARLPLVLFTLRLEPGPNGEKAGDVKPLLHSTDWVNHLLFSPTDPTLLMYCHEGIWQDVDRVWMIHADGTHNTLIHKRTMYMEIWGHEFWGPDGETIWYQWDYPRNADSNFVAGYNVKTGQRFAYHTGRDDGSIHVNVTKDLSLFTGDGTFPGQGPTARDCAWIELFHPQLVRGDSLAVNSPDFWQPGVFHTEHDGDLHRQHVWAQLCLRRRGGEGSQSAGSGRNLDDGAGEKVQPGRSTPEMTHRPRRPTHSTTRGAINDPHHSTGSRVLASPGPDLEPAKASRGENQQKSIQSRIYAPASRLPSTRNCIYKRLTTMLSRL